MNIFRYRGTKFDFNGEERYLRFTFNAIADIQDAFDDSVSNTIKAIISSHENELNARLLRDVLFFLLEDEQGRDEYLYGEKRELKKYSRKQIGWLLDRRYGMDALNAIIDAWTNSMPESDEESEDDAGEESPNVERGAQDGLTSPSQSTGESNTSATKRRKSSK